MELEEKPIIEDQSGTSQLGALPWADAGKTGRPGSPWFSVLDTSSCWRSILSGLTGLRLLAHPEQIAATLKLTRRARGRLNNLAYCRPQAAVSAALSKYINSPEQVHPSTSMLLGPTPLAGG
jgi:hypothetical protein